MIPSAQTMRLLTTDSQREDVIAPHRDLNIVQELIAQAQAGHSEVNVCVPVESKDEIFGVLQRLGYTLLVYGTPYQHRKTRTVHATIGWRDAGIDAS